MSEVSNSVYMVKEIVAADARTIVKKFHYSGKVVANSALHLGVFNKELILVGCLSFGSPMNKTKTPQRLVADSGGYELAIGDKVVATVSNYEELQVRYVHSFTPKGARLSKTVGGGVWSVKFPHQLCKIESAI